MAKRTPAPEPDETNDVNGETNDESTETDESVDETKPPTTETPVTPAGEEAEKRERKSRPQYFIGLDDDPAHRIYIENPVAGGAHEQRVYVGATTYEHSGEDGDGVWLYRQVK